jgi:AAA+ ATPase superfamily predicted ATPase
MVVQDSRAINLFLVEGNSMKALQGNLLIVQVLALGHEPPYSVRIRLLESEQYTVSSPNPIEIKGLDEGPQRGTFIVHPNRLGEVTLNFKVGDEVRTVYAISQMENPYIYGEPLRSERMFFGRVAERSEIFRGVTKANKQNYLITGPRRSGKTSLLYQVEARLEFPFVALMVTPESFGHQHHELFRGLLLRLRDQVFETIGKELPRVDWYISNANAETPVDMFNYYFEKDVKKILASLSTISAQARVVLLIDEANFLVEESCEGGKKVPDSRQEFLRHLLQTFDRIACVLAGTPQALRMTSVTSPLYNIFSGIKLRGLSGQETEQLIREPARSVGVSFEDEAVDRIIELSGCFPYYTQALCGLSLESANENERQSVLPADVHQAAETILDTLDYGFQSVWNALEREEQEILARIAKEPVVVDRMNQETISRLVDMSLVQKVVRDANTPVEKTFANIRAKLDEQWLQREGV